MDIELKAKWLKALASDKFKKGKGVLNRDGMFCCLGVLCEVLELPKHKDLDGYGVSYEYRGLRMGGTLSSQMLTDVGITFAIQSELIFINDSTEDFKQVINAIEEL